MTFDPCKRETWPELLSCPQIAAIWQRKPGGVAKSVQQGTFRPAPLLAPSGAWEKPLRWSKTAVTRYIDTPAAAFRRVS